MSQKITVEKAAKILKITPGLVCRYIKQNRLPAEKEDSRNQRGRKGFLIDRAVLSAFAKVSRKPGPKPTPPEATK